MTDRIPTLSRAAWYDAHSRCPTCNAVVTMTMIGVLEQEGEPFEDLANAGTCSAEGCGWTGPVADCVPRQLLPISRQGRRQMVAVMVAANLCLGIPSRVGVVKALEAITRLPLEDIRHAIVWLGDPLEPLKFEIPVGNIDKLVALCEAVLRNAPVAEANVRAASVAALEAKAKAQAGN